MLHATKLLSTLWIKNHSIGLCEKKKKKKQQQKNKQQNYFQLLLKLLTYLALISVLESEFIVATVVP